MTGQRSTHSLAALDGIVALAIAASIAMPAGAISAGLDEVSRTNIRLMDAAFGVMFIFAWQYCFSILNLYDKFATVPSRITATLKGVAIMMVPIVIQLRVFHPQRVTARIALTTIAALFLYEIGRITISAYLLDRLAARDPRRAIILGSGRRASKAWREIRTRYHSSIAMLGFVDDRSPDEMPPDVAARYLGNMDQLSQILLNEVVDMILIAMPIQSCYPLMQRAIHLAEGVGVPVIYLEDIYSTRKQYESPTQSIFRELAPQQERYLMRLAVKRVVDVCGAVLGLVLLSPLFPLIALGIKLTSKGPIFFRQERYGFRRRRFWLIKFRSMVQDAEQRLPGLEASNDAVGPIFKMNNDPRITSFGRFLRRTSLDELPQLWNVLAGDMSLVGPRPMTIRDVSLFSEASLMRRFSVKAGLTGLWQVTRRNKLGFDEWITMDSKYIDGWSLFLDFKIMARTIGTVIKRTGAI